MIHSFDSADKAIEKSINLLCTELESTQASDDDFPKIVEAISKLRASLNPTIIQKSE